MNVEFKSCPQPTGSHHTTTKLSASAPVRLEKRLFMMRCTNGLGETAYPVHDKQREAMLKRFCRSNGSQSGPKIQENQICRSSYAAVIANVNVALRNSKCWNSCRFGECCVAIPVRTPNCCVNCCQRAAAKFPVLNAGDWVLRSTTIGRMNGLRKSCVKAVGPRSLRNGWRFFPTRSSAQAANPEWNRAYLRPAKQNIARDAGALWSYATAAARGLPGIKWSAATAAQSSDSFSNVATACP